MRKFGKNETEYFEFQLEGSDKVYKIPLAAHMPYKTLQELSRKADTDERFDVQVEMLRKYMGDTVDELTAGTLSDILSAWGTESMSAGASVGEH